MSIDFSQLRHHVVRPTLKHFEPVIPYGIEAEDLILGTIAQESHGRYLKQLGRGPALGVIQMEPFTFNDIYDNYLAYQPEIMAKLEDLELPEWLGVHGPKEIIGNLYYAVAMCRIFYRRLPDALPADVEGMADLWKRRYNTYLGAGTREEFIRNYEKYIAG